MNIPSDAFLKDAMYSLIILLGTLFFALFFKYIFRNIIHALVRKTKTNLDDLVVQETSRPIFFLIILVGIYFSTRTFSLFSSFVFWIDRGFFILVMLFFAWIITRIFKVLVPHWLKVQKRYEKSPQLINKIINVIIFIIVIVMVLAYFKIEISPLIATLGIGGIAVGLALQDTLKNFFAGMHLISDKPIVPGDIIELEDGKYSGSVEDITWRSTKIKTPAGNLILVPNTKIAESIIKNFSTDNPEINVTVNCSVDYDSNLKKVEEIALEIAKTIQKRADGAVKNFNPILRFTAFGDKNIKFSVTLKTTNSADRTLITHEFIKALKQRFDKEGIEISSPVRLVYLEKAKKESKGKDSPL